MKVNFTLNVWTRESEVPGHVDIFYSFQDGRDLTRKLTVKKELRLLVEKEIEESFKASIKAIQESITKEGLQ